MWLFRAKLLLAAIVCWLIMVGIWSCSFLGNPDIEVHAVFERFALRPGERVSASFEPKLSGTYDVSFNLGRSLSPEELLRVLGKSGEEPSVEIAWSVRDDGEAEVGGTCVNFPWPDRWSAELKEGLDGNIRLDLRVPLGNYQAKEGKPCRITLEVLRSPESLRESRTYLIVGPDHLLWKNVVVGSMVAGLWVVVFLVLGFLLLLAHYVLLAHRRGRKQAPVTTGTTDRTERYGRWLS